MSTIPVAKPAHDLTPPAIEPQRGFSLSIGLLNGYQQIVDFRMGGVAVLGVDECPPNGHGWGPSPAHLLGSALGTCLAGALLKSLRDANVEVLDLRTHVTGTMRRDARGQSYLSGISVKLTPVVTRETASIPSARQLAERSMIADALRSDLDVRVAITPEIQRTTSAPAGARYTATLDARPVSYAPFADMLPK